MIKISELYQVSTDYLLCLENNKKQGLDLSGLTDAEIDALSQLIKAMKEA